MSLKDGDKFIKTMKGINTTKIRRCTIGKSK